MKNALLLAVVLSFGTLLAQSPLSLDLQRFVVTVEGEGDEATERLLETLEAQPGQTIEERVVATNTTETLLEGIEIVLPVPLHTSYLPGSASHGVPGVLEPEVSLDGEHFALPPLFRTEERVVDGRSVEEEVEVPPAEYTHARWRIERLEPGAVVTLSLRAVVR